MTRIRIRRAKPSDLAIGKRFQAVTETDLGVVVNRAPASRTKTKALQAARTLAYQSTAALGGGALPWQTGGAAGGGGETDRAVVAY